MQRENQAASEVVSEGSRIQHGAAGAPTTPAPAEPPASAPGTAAGAPGPDARTASTSLAPPRRPRVMIVGPLPPPPGGGQLLLEMADRSKLARGCDPDLLGRLKRTVSLALETPSLR